MVPCSHVLRARVRLGQPPMDSRRERGRASNKGCRVGGSPWGAGNNVLNCPEWQWCGGFISSASNNIWQVARGLFKPCSLYRSHRCIGRNILILIRFASLRRCYRSVTLWCCLDPSFNWPIYSGGYHDMTAGVWRSNPSHCDKHVSRIKISFIYKVSVKSSC